jgi:hypothetical protein
MTKQPLPKFEPIELADIPAASTLVFYGGNKLTEWVGGKIYKHPYTPPAFHAAFYMIDGLVLNVGKFRTVEELAKERRAKRRIDVIIYKKMPNIVRQRLVRYAALDTSKPKVGICFPDYGFTDFLRFGLRFLKPSKKDFCSENVVEVFAHQKVKVSDLKPVDTAPWDLFEYALAHPDECEVRTYWTGPEFRY